MKRSNKGATFSHYCRSVALDIVFDVDKLKEFYETVSAQQGICVTAFQDMLRSLFDDERVETDVSDYRLGKGPWKKLRDEVVPVSLYLEFNNIEAGRIRFPLDDNVPDCWLTTANGHELGIEVTIERGREKYHLATELNETGMGRGFVGIQDDALQGEFDSRKSNPRTMFTSEQALKATKAGILRCLRRKNDKKYTNVFYLLIQAHLKTLPNDRWEAIKRELSEVAKTLPFQEVHIVGDTGTKPYGFQIK